jgi:hypothetical protein
MKGLEKLPLINYRMAIHEGDANRRLASQAWEISLLPNSLIPSRYRDQFAKLKLLIEQEINELPDSLMVPVRLGNIQRSTAVKYIKLLIEIEDEFF